MKNLQTMNPSIYKNLHYWFPFILFMLLYGYCTAQSPYMKPFNKINGKITAIYYPNAINTPLLNEKGAFQIGGSTQFSFIKHNDDIFGFPDNKRSFNVDAAYALSNHFLLAANFFSQTKDSDLDYFFGELAVGYFNTIKTRNPEKLTAQFEILLGIGKGGSYRKLQRVFIQPAIGLNANNWHFSYAARIARTTIESSGSTAGVIEAEFDPLKFIAFSLNTFESNFRLSRDFGSITPYIQYTRLEPLDKPASFQWASDFSSAFNIGLSVEI